MEIGNKVIIMLIVKYLLILIVFRSVCVLVHTFTFFLKILYLTKTKKTRTINMPECRLLCTSLFEVVLVYYYYIPRLQAYQIVYFFLKNRFKTPIDLKNLIKLFLIFLTKRFFYYITGIPYAVYLIMLDVYRFLFVSNLYSIRIFLRNKCLNLYGGLYNNNSCINIYHGVILVNFN
jgi:hypothetical protein